jgi:hypothetical protein
MAVSAVQVDVGSRQPPDALASPSMAIRDSEILERAVRAVSEKAAEADAVIDEAIDAGLDGSDQVTLQAKLVRLELLNVKADLERELALLVLDCSRCGQTVHWVPGLGVAAGHWAHAEPAPHREPTI